MPRFDAFSRMKPKQFVGLLALLLTAGSMAIAACPAQTARVLRGSNQETTYASTFPDPLVVWVVDPVTQKSVSGLRVDFAPGDGIGLSSSYSITDEHGLASVQATGLAACTSSVTAQVAGALGSKVIFEGLVVNKAALAVVPADLESTVGHALPAVAKFTIEGFVNGDTMETANITGAPVLTTTATDHSPHANYAIKGGPGTLESPNYVFVAGFGTLAMLSGNDSNVEPDATERASIHAEATEPVPQERAALVSDPTTVTIPEPVFVAGLRGSSGVFVRDAIWPRPRVIVAKRLTSDTRSAMKVVVAETGKVPDAPVRAVALPVLSTSAALTNQHTDTKSAMPFVAAASLRTTEAPVRAVMPTIQPVSAVAVQTSFSGAAIRKAFNPPGGN